MVNRKYLSYCGAYCELCGARNSTPRKANELLSELKVGEFEEWGRGFDEFDDFWKLLNTLSEVPEDRFCKSGKCGHPRCSIRKCAKGEDLEICAFCDEYPCDYIIRFSKSEPLLLHDGARIKEVEVDAWIMEQEERKKKGFDYGIIRCCKSDIPLDNE